MEAKNQTDRIKIVVADDIPDTLNMVCSLIQEICPQVDIVGRHTTLEATKKTIDTKQPDVVLLDIQFSAEGKTAYDLLEEYQKNKQNTFKLIIFSGHCEAEYYDMAFQYDAVHFLPKPIDKKRLKEAIQRTKQLNIKKNDTDLTNYWKDKLVINTATKSYFITLGDIVLLQSKDSRTYIMLTNEEVIKSSRNLGYFESQLTDYKKFIRVHNNTILNIDYVQGIYNKTDRNIILKPPFGEVKSSREKFKDLMKRLEE